MKLTEIKRDSFWDENAKLTDEEIDKKFSVHTANSLKAQKSSKPETKDLKRDSFWDENAKLSDKEIDKRFSVHTANSLKAQKIRALEKEENI